MDGQTREGEASGSSRIKRCDKDGKPEGVFAVTTFGKPNGLFDTYYYFSPGMTLFEITNRIR
jgi:hypothetical protein